MNILERINVRLDNELLNEVNSLFSIAQSNCRFDAKDELKTHLIEGALLNVTRIGSKALSIPSGEYMVWITDAGHTMLVPVQEAHHPESEVFENINNSQYEILTKDLLDNWNKLERVIHEEDNDYEGIAKTIDVDTVDRMPILRAMEDRGFTVTSLASEVGVDPPAISRILRTPKDVQGDPKGRNPSMGLASQICSALRIDPTSAFPDIFGPQANYEPRKSPGNRGSGMANAAHGSTRKGAASRKWTQGSVAEGIYDQPMMADKPLTNSEITRQADQTTNDPKVANDLAQQTRQQEERERAEKQQRDKLLEPQLKALNQSMTKMNLSANQGQQAAATNANQFNNLDTELGKVNTLLSNLRGTAL